MPRQHASTEDLVRELVTAIATATTAPPSLTGPSTASGMTKPTGFRNPMTAPGDTIYGGESGAARRRGIGALGQVYTVVDDGTGELVPDWQDASDGEGSVDVSRLDLLTNGDADNPALIWGITETGDVRVIFTERSA